jgi:hypothetical protein
MNIARSEVLATVIMQSSIFWDKMPCKSCGSQLTVDFHQTTRRYIPEDRLYQYCHAIEWPSHIHFFSLGRLSKESVQVRDCLNIFETSLFFYGEELLAPRPNPKLEDHPLSAVRDCLFNIFAATLHTWRASPPSATWGRAMPWWQGTHITWQSCSTNGGEEECI